jgi:hypothetical protein
LGTALNSECGKKKAANAIRKNVETKQRCGAGRSGRGVKLKRKGSLSEKSVVVMLLDVVSPPHAKSSAMASTFGVEEMGGWAEKSSRSHERCMEVLKKVRKLRKSGPISGLAQSSIVERMRAAVVVARGIDRGGNI